MAFLNRRILGDVALVLGSIVFTLLVFEFVLRSFSPQVFDIHPRWMYTSDPDVGYVLTPNFEGALQREEFLSSFSTNSLGLRGNEIGAKGERHRILVLGDSQAFGFGVEDDETYAFHLEECLNRQASETYEVLNGGVPGYGTVDQLNFLRAHGAALQPDLVILNFLNQNDLFENRHPAVGWAYVPDGWLTYREDSYDPLALRPFWRRAEAWLKKNFHSAKFLSERVGSLLLHSGLFPKLELAVWGEEFTAEDERIFEQAVLDIRDHAKSLRAEFMFVYTTNQGPVVSRKERSLPSESLVARLMATHGIQWVNMLPAMRISHQRNELYYPLDGHWNPSGHRFVASHLCRVLTGTASRVD